MCIMDKVTDKNKLEFAIFCIENIAIKLKKDGSEVYSALAEKSSLLFDYILSNYDMFHTQDKDYIVNDILEAAKEEGIKI